MQLQTSKVFCFVGAVCTVIGIATLAVGLVLVLKAEKEDSPDIIAQHIT